MSDTSTRYERGDLSADDLEAEVRQFFASAADDAAVQRDAEEAGIELDELLAGGPGQVEVEPREPGFTGVEETILVLLLTPVVQSAWSEVVLPWLRRRHAKPLGTEQDGES
jgi:hypothetical protein